MATILIVESILGVRNSSLTPSIESLKNLKDKIGKDIPNIKETECIANYNPDKWRYNVFYFIDNLKKVKSEEGAIYDILHISQEKDK